MINPMIFRSKSYSKWMILLALTLLQSCSITPYSEDALEKINWQVQTNGTKTGKLVKERLANFSSDKQSDKEDKKNIYTVHLSGESMRTRTIGVDESGQPSTYLQEALVQLRVSSKGKEFINEPIITAREFSQQESNKQIEQQKEEMFNELANDTILRLNDIANTDKNALLHKYNLYQELYQHPKPQITPKE